MKKRIIGCLALCLLLAALAGCRGSEGPGADVDREKNPLYYFYSTINPTELQKLNLATGTVTPLSPDPIDGGGFVAVDHDYVVQVGHQVAFIRPNTARRVEGDIHYDLAQVCHYDLDTDTYTVLDEFWYTRDTYYQWLYFTRGYVYYFQDTVEGEDLSYTLIRIDVKTLEKKTYDAAYQFQAIRNGRIYFKDRDGIYTTDLELSNRQNLLASPAEGSRTLLTVGETGKLYYLESPPTERPSAVVSGEVYSYDPATGETVHITKLSGCHFCFEEVDGRLFYTYWPDRRARGGDTISTWAPGDKAPTVYYNPEALITEITSCGSYLLVNEMSGGRTPVVLDTAQSPHATETEAES